MAYEKTDNRDNKDFKKKRLPSFPSLSVLVGKKAPSNKGGRTCPFSYPGAPKADYKNPDHLRRYVSERGKLTPSRITGVSFKKQRLLAKEVKRARFLALLPYVDK